MGRKVALSHVDTTAAWQQVATVLAGDHREQADRQFTRIGIVSGAADYPDKGKARTVQVWCEGYAMPDILPMAFGLATLTRKGETIRIEIV